MAGEAVIDWHRLRSLGALGEPDLVVELVALFSTEATLRAALLQDALRDGRSGDIRRIAHMLRGAAGDIGAPLLAALSGALEERAGGGAVDDDMIDLVHQVCGALRDACAALEAGDNEP